MFDMKQLQVRYFEVRLSSGQKIDVEPPKLKVIKAISDLARSKPGAIKENAGDVFQDLADALSRALSKNKQNKKITADYILDTMNIDEIQELLKAYFLWVGEIQHTKN